jgi:hypothetical protein
MKKIFCLFAILVCSATCFAQSSDSPLDQPAKANLGIGFGLDYGGIGARFTYMIVPKFGLFGSIGYVLVGPGYNFGATYKFMSDKRVVPTISAMYGYNAAIKVSGGYDFEEIYLGPSVSVGLEVKGKKRVQNYWNFELVIPFRSSDYEDDMDRLDALDVDMTDLPPIAFSIGYHIGL